MDKSWCPEEDASAFKRAQILLLPLISISQFLIQNTSFLWAKPLRKTTGFQVCPSSKASSHTQPSHGQPSQRPVHLAKWPVVCLATKLAQNSETSKSKTTRWFQQELVSFQLTKSGWTVNVNELGRWPSVLAFGGLIKSEMLKVSQLIWALIWAAWTKC